MRLPRMSRAEAAVFGAVFAHERERELSIIDESHTENIAAENALDAALWALQCFRQAVRERKEP